MPQRNLELRDLNEAIAELDRLEKTGCRPLGQWDFAQVCDHLSYFVEGPLDGHPYKVNWLLKTLFGRMMLKKILSGRKMKVAVPTPQKPLPVSGGDPKAAAARLRKALIRLRDHQGEFIDSPFFGHLTPEQWRQLQTIHCAHHFAFLQPNG